MSRVEIKPISEAYFDGFYACLDAVARERKYLGFVHAPAREATLKWLKDGMGRGTIRVVAVHGSSVVGWCDIERTEREGFTHAGKLGMGVLKGYRRRGIGTALLENALEEAQKQGLERVELDVYASNSTAARLYERSGFRLEGRKQKARKLDGAYDDILVMAKIF